MIATLSIIIISNSGVMASEMHVALWILLYWSTELKQNATDWLLKMLLYTKALMLKS